jgi:hypothetical protein
MDGQKRWLNEMAARGFRLKECGKISYVFEECKPGMYEYTIEFVGDKSNAKAREYQSYLEGLGFRTFTKNVNLNLSFGKARWRPYARGMGQIATSPGSYNKELLILEKKKDGKPFELHTDMRDKLDIYKNIRNAYAYSVILMIGLAAMTFIPGISSLSTPLIWALRAIIAAVGIFYLIPTVQYSLQVRHMKTESTTFE